MKNCTSCFPIVRTVGGGMVALLIGMATIGHAFYEPGEYNIGKKMYDSATKAAVTVEAWKHAETAGSLMPTIIKFLDLVQGSSPASENVLRSLENLRRASITMDDFTAARVSCMILITKLMEKQKSGDASMDVYSEANAIFKRHLGEDLPPLPVGWNIDWEDPAVAQQVRRAWDVGNAAAKLQANVIHVRIGLYRILHAADTSTRKAALEQFDAEVQKILIQDLSFDSEELLDNDLRDKHRERVRHQMKDMEIRSTHPPDRSKMHN